MLWDEAAQQRISGVRGYWPVLRVRDKGAGDQWGLV